MYKVGRFIIDVYTFKRREDGMVKKNTDTPQKNYLISMNNSRRDKNPTKCRFLWTPPTELSANVEI